MSLEKEMAHLQEFRSRLISDVVAGKPDVREAAVSLPEQIDDSEQIEAEDVIDEFEDSVGEDFEPEEAAA